jgi:hypothetical protein
MLDLDKNEIGIMAEGKDELYNVSSSAAYEQIYVAYFLFMF